MKALSAIGLALVMALVFGFDSRALGSPTASRCLRVSIGTVRVIHSGMKPQYGRIRLRGVRAVRSRDYSHVYFVSADLQDASLPGPDDIATWAVGRIKGPPAGIFSAEHVAQAFTDWGKVPNGSIADDGLLQSQDCTRKALGG